MSVVGGDENADAVKWRALLSDLLTSPLIGVSDGGGGVAAFTPTGAVAFGSGYLADADVCARVSPSMPSLFAAVAAAADITGGIVDVNGGGDGDGGGGTDGGGDNGGDGNASDGGDGNDDSNAIANGDGATERAAAWTRPLLICGDALTPICCDNATVCATSKYKRSGCVCARLPFAFLVVYFTKPARLRDVAPLVDAVVRRLRQ
jgi:hypothetical protein